MRRTLRWPGAEVLNATRTQPSSEERLRAEIVRLRSLLRQAGIEATVADVRHTREMEDAADEAEASLAESRAETAAAADVVEALGRAMRRQAALVELGDRFRDLDDPAEMAAVASEIIGRTLDASRAGYGTVDPTTEFVDIPADWRRDGMSSIAGHYRFADFGSFIADLRRGETVMIDDVARDPRTSDHAEAFAALHISALLNLPVMEGGRVVAILLVHDDKPRLWSPEKLDFVRDVAGRTRDALERRRAEENERLLQGELQHRVKNTLAMVQAIAGQTFRATESAAARETFNKRIVSLAQANDILVHAGSTAAAIRDVVASATTPHCAPADRFTVDGPDLEIAASAALSLTLALHELCTNAVKYGALSNDTGHVTIEWAVLPEATFRLRWTERGGPPVTPPTRTGFGSRLIARSLGSHMNGSVKTDYDPTGITCTFEAPLAAVKG